MSHFCRICKTYKPNERFSGKGHGAHICNKCKKMDKDKRRAIEQEDEIFGFLKQKNISAKNIKRLEKLMVSPNTRIAELADSNSWAKHEKIYCGSSSTRA